MTHTVASIRADLAPMLRGKGYIDYGKCEVTFNNAGIFSIIINKRVRFESDSLKRVSHMVAQLL